MSGFCFSDCHIVDVGSGLGYIDQILSRNWNHSVFGIESHTGHSQSASRRDQKVLESSIANVTQINFSLNCSDESRLTVN